MKSVDILSNDINEYNQFKNEYSKVNTKDEINEELEFIKINKINFRYDINSPIILKELFLEIKKVYRNYWKFRVGKQLFLMFY